MGLFEEILSDYVEVFDSIGVSVGWGGGAYTALVSENPLDSTMDAVALREAQKVTVKFLREDLGGAVPRKGEVLEVSGERLRVAKVIDRPPHPLVIVEATR